MRELWYVDDTTGPLEHLLTRFNVSPRADTTILSAKPPEGNQDVFFLDEAVPPEGLDQHNGRVAKWVDDLSSFLQTGKWEETGIYRGVPIWDGSRHSLFFSVQHLISAAIRGQRIVDAFSPSQIHLIRSHHNLDRISLALASTAAARRIPCIVHQVSSSVANDWSNPIWRARAAERIKGVRERMLSWPNAQMPRFRDLSKRVLAVEFYYSHGNFIQPVFDQLDELGDVDTCLLAFRSKVSRRMIPLGIRVMPAYRIHTSDMKRRLRDAAARFASRIEKAFEDKSIDPIWTVADSDLRSSHGILRRVLLNTYITATKTVEQCQYAIENIKPDVLISTTEVSLHSRIAFLTGRINGLPSVCIQHGVMYTHPLDARMVSTSQAMWGAGAKDILVQQGNPAERLVVTGCSNYDRLFGADHQIVSSLRSLYPEAAKPNGPFLAVYTTQPPGSDCSHDERDRTVATIIKAAMAFPQSKWLFKLHPADTGRPYQKLIHSVGATNVRVVQSADVFPILAGSHLVVTIFSTTGIEAMILEKPLIQVNLSGQADRVQYAAYGAALAVRSEGEMVQAVSRALWDAPTRQALSNGQRMYLDKFVGPRDGLASSRVAQLIYATAQGRRND